MTNTAPLAKALLEKARHDGREAHERALTLVEDLTDEQLTWRPGKHAPSIGFHVWHLARWSDFDATQVSGARQIWETQRLAQAWGFPSALGQADAGTEMGDDASENLILPGKTALIEYAGLAFAAVDEALDQAAVALLKQGERHPDRERLVDLIYTYLQHDNRHLGMIEALRGLLGLTGSATN